MNTGIQTFKLSTPCCVPLVNYDALMCLPGAIIGTYYCGLAGCLYGAVKSIYAGSAFATGKALMANNTQVIAKRIITPACASNMINTGIECGATGFKTGICTGLIYGIGSAEYQTRTNKRLPDIEMELSLPPKIQVIDRT